MDLIVHDNLAPPFIALKTSDGTTNLVEAIFLIGDYCIQTT